MHLLANRPDPWNKRPELTQLLLDKRADPMRLTARRAATPLHMAAGTANLEVARVLLNHPGAEVNAKNKDNKHPLDCASHRSMRQLLEEYHGVKSPDQTGGSSKDEPNARRGASTKRLERAQLWRIRC